MKPESRDFVAAAARAMADPVLQGAMAKAKRKFVSERAHAVAALPEFAALRDAAAAIKDHTLDHLDLYLERYREKVEAAGGHVHLAATPEDARRAILELCRAHEVRLVTRGKSMVAEEIALNPALEQAGIVPVETDMGEYILQLAGERPSHIIGPATHKTKDQVAGLFRRHHGGERPRERREDLVAEGREMLRARYFAADAGILGANLLIAGTGQAVSVTNEGNGDLTQHLPRLVIVIAGIEKLVPTMEDAGTILRVLARSATGQEMSAYTTLSAGPRRPGEAEGPEHYHVILLDNGRSAMLGDPALRALLRCIRCGACMNHCPVYQTVGGHAYGWVYPGPLGAALDPALIGLDEARHLPQASTLCGACAEVCPVRIPLPDILRIWRERANAGRLTPWPERLGVRLWAQVARRPWLYRLTIRLARPLARWRLRHAGRLP